MTSGMKRIFAVFVAAVILISAAFSVFIFKTAERAFRAERETVCAVSGAVLGKYPDALRLIGGALDGGDGYAEAGMAALAKYGYDDAVMTDKDVYGRLALTGAAASAAAGALFIAAGGACMYAAERRRRVRMRAAAEILDKCLSGSYAPEDISDVFGGDIVSDRLKKVCDAVRLRSEELDAERDNTKTLVTDISHQLKTPLSALKSCFAVYGCARTEAEREEFIKRCDTQIGRLESLTDALVSISKLETGMIEPKPERVSVTELLTDAVSAVYYRALKKDIEIDTDEFEDTDVTADRKWTAEALANILDNAVKYSPRGGKVKLRVQRRQSFVRIEIEDSGIGIPKAESNKVFMRFYRGASDAVKNEEGSGVGLYLARKLTESLGGTVSHRPAPGGGTVFAVQLLTAERES